MKNIFVNRQSICMADDMDDHAKTLTVEDNCSYLGVIEAVANARYLPPYDTLWLLCSDKHGFIAAYYSSGYNDHCSDIFWQEDFPNTEEIGNDVSFCFDCDPFKRELWRNSSDYDIAVQKAKAKYRISDRLFGQIDACLHNIRMQ